MKSRETDVNFKPRRVLLIGYGNPLRGDDALGRVIAERVAESARPEGIDVIVTHQLTPELAEPLSRADLVIFVDAAMDQPAGRIRIVPVMPEPLGTHSLAHAFGPERLLATAQRIFGHRPEAWSISVGGKFWGYSDELSPEIQQLVPRLLHHIELLIAARIPVEPSHA